MMATRLRAGDGLFALPTPLRADWRATARQAEIIALIGAGLTLEVVARTVGISLSTLKGHMASIAHALRNPDELSHRDLIFLHANYCRWLAQRTG